MMVCRAFLHQRASLRATAAMPRLCAPPYTLPQSPVHKVPRQLPAPRHWPAAFWPHHSCAAAFCGGNGAAAAGRRSGPLPEASQFFSALHRRCRSLALRLLCFFFDQKGLLLPDVLGRKLQIYINYTPCPADTRFVTEFGRAFTEVSLYFHISASSNARISSGRGLSTAMVRACSSTGVSSRMPPGTLV